MKSAATPNVEVSLCMTSGASCRTHLGEHGHAMRSTGMPPSYRGRAGCRTSGGESMRISFGTTPNKGLLFLANGIGALVAGGAFLEYVLSRTVGLPGLPVEPDAWLEPLGGASLVAEAV